MGKKRNRQMKWTKHHLIPRSLGGNSKPRNILYIKRLDHDLWHKLFGNLTLLQIIEALIELERRKKEDPNGRIFFEEMKNGTGNGDNDDRVYANR